MSAHEWANRVETEGYASAIEAAHDLAIASNAPGDYNYTAQRETWMTATNTLHAILASVNGSNPTIVVLDVEGTVSGTAPTITGTLVSA
jgi:hypothetical protein